MAQAQHENYRLRESDQRFTCDASGGWRRLRERKIAKSDCPPNGKSTLAPHTEIDREDLTEKQKAI
jgi:hypothetical protein